VETLPPLQKLDDAWLSPNHNSQWEQPIQTTTGKEEPTLEDEITADFNSLSIKQETVEQEKHVPETQVSLSVLLNH
jgi:hypothetical protein